MDILSSTGFHYNNKNLLFNDVLQNSPATVYSPMPGLSSVATDTEDDALWAVKMDPAVLEAKVTVDTAQRGRSMKNNGAGYRDNVHKPNSAPTYTSPRKDENQKTLFENAVSLHQAALLSLSSSHFNLVLDYVDTMRRQRYTLQKQMECAFCKNNGRPEMWYSTHPLKDGKGRVKCPVLRGYSCRRCGATGDRAHTIKYCPENYW